MMNDNLIKIDLPLVINSLIYDYLKPLPFLEEIQKRSEERRVRYSYKKTSSAEYLFVWKDSKITSHISDSIDNPKIQRQVRIYTDSPSKWDFCEDCKEWKILIRIRKIKYLCELCRFLENDL